jgi:UDP-glucuronate 4-epimerase
MSGAILVTGAAGFIGSHLVEALLSRGDRVVALDNFDEYYDPAIKRRNVVPVLDHPGYTLIEGDIRDAGLLDTLFAQRSITSIVHLAARAGVRPSIADPLLYEDVNCRGTAILLEAARRHRCTNFVFASSSSVYGSDSEAPFIEMSAADRPSSPYAATKRAGELACHAYSHLYHMNVTCLRFFTVYGPRQRPEMAISLFTRLIDQGAEVAIFGDGRSLRDYTFIDDIVDGVVRAIDHLGGYRIYNLGTSVVTSLLELTALISQRVGRPLRLHYLPAQPGDVPITYADTSLAAHEIGYSASTSLERGLDAYVDWYHAECRPQLRIAR